MGKGMERISILSTYLHIRATHLHQRISILHYHQSNLKNTNFKNIQNNTKVEISFCRLTIAVQNTKFDILKKIETYIKEARVFLK